MKSKASFGFGFTLDDFSLDKLYWQFKDLGDSSVEERFLAALETHAPSAAAELRKMLAVESKVDDFLNLPDDPTVEPGTLDRTPVQMLDQLPGAPSTGGKPVQIGPYRLLEPIGEGGMGIVYLAHQKQPVRRNVAIKVIKPGMDSRQVIARFEAERQALALMEHPNIAKVLDAGTTDSGLPYFVMELVRGIPITEYCARCNMDTRDRLELFLTACSAIQHAHNKGIIHRDIKPSNVLVTEHDGTPVVKVIDFGVAKALTENLTEATLYTGVFQMIGTPLYMSPEQASLSGLDVDTRSDVYSLGVLLYELISGMLPIDRESVKQMNFEQLRQHICSAKPLRPSRRLSTAKDERQTIAETPQLGLSQAANVIHNELDWIVMRSIEKDRNLRYASPRELAADISRYLAGESVQACPPTLAYQASKLLRRHCKSFAVAAIVLFSLAAATLISTHQAIKARQASALATRNAGLAEQKAAELTEFVYAEDMVAASRHYLSGDHVKFERSLERHASPDRAHLRGFEWDLMQMLVPVETQTLFECNEQINDFVVDSAAKRVIIGGSRGGLYSIDLNSGKQLATFKSSDEPILAIDLSPQGRLSWAGNSGTISVGQLDESLDLSPHVRETAELGAKLLSLAATDTSLWIGNDRGEIFAYDWQSGETRERRDWALRRKIMDLASIPGGAVLAAHANEVFELPRERPAETRREPWRIELSPARGEIRNLAVHHEMGFLVCGQALGGVSLFQLTDAEPQPIFTHLLPDYLHCVAISPDGEWIGAGDASGHIHVLPTQVRYADSFLDSQASRKRQVKTWKAHKGKIEHLVFHTTDAGSKYEILSAGRDGRFVTSRPFDESVIQFLPVEDHVVDFPSQAANCEMLWQQVLGNLTRGDTRFLDGKAENHQVDKNVRIRGISSTHFAALVDEQTLLKMRTTGPDVGEVLWQADADSVATEFAIARDGLHFAICRERLQPRRHSIELYQYGSPLPRHSIRSNLAKDMAFSPCGTKLAYVWNNDVAVIDVVTGERLQLLKTHTDSIQDIEYSPDGTQLASVSSDRRIAVWDATSGKLLWTQQAHTNRAKDIAFHPTLPTIATVGADAYVRFWSTREKVTDDSVRLVGEWPLSVGSCAKVAFSEDGKSLFVHHAELGVSVLRTQSSR